MLGVAPPVTLDDVQKRRDDIIAELHWECPGYYEDHEFELNGDFDEYLLCIAQDGQLDDVDYELYCKGLLIGPPPPGACNDCVALTEDNYSRWAFSLTDYTGCCLTCGQSVPDRLLGPGVWQGYGIV